jgi:hypothetical protein
MDDIADGLLLDVREINIADLVSTGEESALDRALARICASNDRMYSSFNSSI